MHKWLASLFELAYLDHEFRRSLAVLFAVTKLHFLFLRYYLFSRLVPVRCRAEFRDRLECHIDPPIPSPVASAPGSGQLMDFSKLYTNPLLKATMAVASGIVARDGGKRIIGRMSHLKGFSGISLGSLWGWEVL